MSRKSRRAATVGRFVLLLVLSLSWYFASRFEKYLPAGSVSAPSAADSVVTAAPMNLSVHRHTVARGQTFGQILSSGLVQPEDIFPALQALGEIFDPRRLRPGHELQVKVDSTGALHELTYKPSSEVLVRVAREETGAFRSRLDSLPVAVETQLLCGEIHTTLYDAVMAGNESPDLLMAFTDIFQWDLDFFIDSQRGDRFRIFFEKLFVEQEDGSREFARYGRILAAAYEQSDTSLIALYFDDSTGSAGYFDRAGNSFQKTFLKSPLNYRRISSFFSYGRRHPILKKVRAHTGVDFAAPTGTPVAATAAGVITALGWEGGYGNRIVIAHKNRFATLYGHLSKFAAGLKSGAKISQGQVVGYVGATGLATGPHLHYTMYLNGKPINPLKLRPASADPVPAKKLQEFFRQRDRLLMLLEPPAIAKFEALAEALD